MIHNGKPTVASSFLCVGTDATAVGLNNGILIGPAANAVFSLPGLQVDESWGEWAQKAWYATAPFLGVGLGLALTFEEIFTCESIILGINTATPLSSGNPLGIWESPDLLNGGSEFRLSRATDYDLTIQEWFAWPVGSGTVNVQVFQSFDVPVEFPMMTVQLPQLSPHGKEAARRLLDAMQDARDREQGNDPDFSGAGEYRGPGQRNVSPRGGGGFSGGE